MKIRLTLTSASKVGITPSSILSKAKTITTIGMNSAKKRHLAEVKSSSKSICKSLDATRPLSHWPSGSKYTICKKTGMSRFVMQQRF